ncbi:glutamate racemase [Fulvivirga sediminis]|uniref:Glutamate racemase n=1 Tax=Fulvivirga sediminis TaxID=2803949 RepID=A0A937FAC9_9BACT|nr:glutamate racemase [Fulvivirga sediminis]MBL3657539.1 glutamate racemase [Fulvivirga sediminis]
MKSKKAKPVGIFDSGIGGLTVAHAIRNVLPEESMIYFGDTAHLPYGDKSEAAVQAYSVKIADVLLNRGCKVIVIACNSASSAAYELLKEYVGSRAKVVNVIDPMINYIRENFKATKIGLIGTKRTIQSNIYASKIDQLGQHIDLVSQATPLLVPMIEEGFFNNKISSEIIDEYLSDAMFEGIKALILGCTHYPLVKKQIENYYQGKVQVLDSSEITARYLKSFLQELDMLNEHPNLVDDHFLVSDYTESFEASTKIFFRQRVNLEKYPLWD